jgi:hypothetical protein
MKINENLKVTYLNRVYTKSCHYTFYPNGIWDDDLFYSLIFVQNSGYNVQMVRHQPMFDQTTFECLLKEHGF